MNRSHCTHSYSTLVAIVALAFIVACVAHEATGHGGACLAIGGRVTLLTSVYFHCTSGGPLTDAAGPLMNLVVGAVCWLCLRTRLVSSNFRLFLVFAMAFNLFWGAGYFILSSVTNTGDWAFVLRDLALEPHWAWRLLMGSVGILFYVLSMRAVAACLPPRTPLIAAYLVAGAVSCCAALFFPGPVLPAVGEAAQESLGASVGLLVLANRNSRRTQSTSSVLLAPYSTRWLLSSILITIAFFLLLGRGFGAAGHT